MDKAIDEVREWETKRPKLDCLPTDKWADARGKGS